MHITGCQIEYQGKDKDSLAEMQLMVNHISRVWGDMSQRGKGSEAFLALDQFPAW